MPEQIIEESKFVQAFSALQKAAHQNSVDKGFWESPDADFLENIADSQIFSAGLRLKEISAKTRQQNDGEKIALMHAELSEALEGIRHGNPPSEHIPEFTAVEEELADVIIRIMDYAQARRFRVAEAVVAKMKFNATRPHKHGKTF